MPANPRPSPVERASETLEQFTRGARQRRAWITVVLMAQLWLWVNGRALLGSQFLADLAIVYLQFIEIPLLMDDEFKRTLLSGTLQEYALKFTLGFVITAALYVVIFALPSSPLPTARPSIPYSSVLPLLVLQLVFVAPAEELFFRGFLPRLYDPGGKSWKIYAGVSLSDAFTATTFSSFHYAAYGIDASSSFLFAFILAMLWLFASRKVVGYPFHADGARRPMGIPFTIGSHFAWNLCVFGILFGRIITGA